MIWLVAFVAGVALALSVMQLLWAAEVEAWRRDPDAAFNRGYWCGYHDGQNRYQAGIRDAALTSQWPRRRAR